MALGKIERKQEIDTYGGTGRLGFWLWSLLNMFVFFALFVGVFFLMVASLETLAERPAISEGINELMLFFAPSVGAFVAWIGFFVLYLLVELLIFMQRLKNSGTSRWCTFLAIVPFINIWVYYRVYCCPEGYEDHRQLDWPGKILAFLFFLVMILSLLGSIKNGYEKEI